MLECWNAFSLLLKLLKAYFCFYSQLSGSLFNHRAQQTFVLMKTSWRRLEDDVRLGLQKTSSRQTCSLYSYVFKTSWSRPIYSCWSYVLKTSSRRFQDVLTRCLQNVFKTSWRHLQDVFKTSSRRLQDIFKTPSRHFQDVFKTFSRHLQYVLQRCLQDAFKTYHQVILFLLTSFQDVFKTYSQRFWGVLQR